MLLTEVVKHIRHDVLTEIEVGAASLFLLLKFQTANIALLTETEETLAAIPRWWNHTNTHKHICEHVKLNSISCQYEGQTEIRIFLSL